MKKLVALLQLLATVVLGIFALATAVNLVLISMRPETISVVNAIIGQGILIICMLALASISLRKGLKGLRSDSSGTILEESQE
jgi:hypothetical protein|tara:strand:+ start:1432 stop:1680 length:249 start_codon:yes stop_codon:yes gene_type:complete